MKKIADSNHNPGKNIEEKNSDNILFFSVTGLLIIVVLLISILVSIERIFPLPDVALQSFNFSRHGKLVFDDSFRGTNPDSNITFAMFTDFNCPACLEQHKDIEKLMMNYTNVNFIFKYLTKPDDYSGKFSAALFECTKSSAHMLEIHSYLFNSEVSNSEKLNFIDSLGFNTTKIEDCVNSPDMTTILEGDKLQASMLDVRGTPTVFLNGIKIEGAHTYDIYSKLIEAEMKGIKLI